jgi:hypothetical protein
MYATVLYQEGKKMERRSGIALIASLLVALLVPVGTNAQACDPTPIDSVNIGDPLSEAGHDLHGWGPIEPAHSGGTFGDACQDGNCRVISSPDDDNGSDWARFTMDFGDSQDTKCLQLCHLQGYSRDSFYVYIDALGEPGDGTEVFYWPGELSGIEDWHTAEIPLDLAGVHTHTIYLLSDQSHWSGWSTYGQVAFTWAAVVPDCTLSEEPTAITLASFTAEADGGSVALGWTTAAEIDNAGFNVYRATTPDGPYTQVNGALIAAAGDPTSGASYSLLDKGLAPGTYHYKLEDIDLNGVATLHGPVAATVTVPLRRPLYRPTMPY